MPYQGLADVTVSAKYFGHEPVEIENPNTSVRLHNAGPGLVELHFAGNLNGPANASHVTVTLPNGLVLSGELKQGEQGAEGGWLSFTTESAGLGM